MSTYQAREPYERVVHILRENATMAQFDQVQAVAFLPRQSIVFSMDDACLPIDGLRSRTLIFWDISPTDQPAYRSFVNLYYAAPDIPTYIEFRQFALPPPLPPPLITSKVLLGVNVIAYHQLAYNYGDMGCRYFQVLDNFGVSMNLAERYPDAIVVHRRYMPWGMSGYTLAAHMMEGTVHRRVIYETLNECDNGQGYGTPKELNDRLDAELEAARIVREWGYRVSLGAYSMGCPDLWNDEIIDIFRRRVAPLYNSDPGLYIGFHLYTRKFNQDFDIWYARRWTRLFEACGFDPKLQKVLCSETGVDEGGVGGFSQHGYSQEQFIQWCHSWTKCESAPVAVGDGLYPSPLLGGALFQVGNSTDWAGYNLEGYIPALAQNFWT